MSDKELNEIFSKIIRIYKNKKIYIFINDHPLKKRIIELFGVILAAISLLLIISFISYSPDDPNFIFPENTKIKNLLGSNGSYISDVFMQSFGLMSFLVPITFFFTSINIFKNKKLLVIIENMIFSIFYLIFGCLFFSVFLYLYLYFCICIQRRAKLLPHLGQLPPIEL